MNDDHDVTFSEMKAVTMRVPSQASAGARHALVEALDGVDEAIYDMRWHPSSATMRRLNCAWTLALRRHRYYAMLLRNDRGHPA